VGKVAPAFRTHSHRGLEAEVQGQGVVGHTDEIRGLGSQSKPIGAPWLAVGANAPFDVAIQPELHTDQSVTHEERNGFTCSAQEVLIRLRLSIEQWRQTRDEGPKRRQLVDTAHHAGADGTVDPEDAVKPHGGVQEVREGLASFLRSRAVAKESVPPHEGDRIVRSPDVSHIEQETRLADRLVQLGACCIEHDPVALGPRLPPPPVGWMDSNRSKLLHNHGKRTVTQTI
jgi:hypothetical protein